MKVYVMQSEGEIVKIGRAHNPAIRWAQLKTGHPFNLTLVHEYTASSTSHANAIEKAAHAKLASCRMSGEWFRCSADAAIQAVQEAAAFDWKDSSGGNSFSCGHARSVENTRPATERTAPQCRECCSAREQRARERQAEKLEAAARGEVFSVIPKTNAEHQAAYRDRRKARLKLYEKRTTTLQQILTMLEGNQKPMAVKLRAVAEEGLT